MNTIRQQLTRKLLLGFALLLGLGGAGVYISTRAALLKEFDDALFAKATAIASLTELERDKIEVEVPDRLTRGSGERAAEDFFEMWDANLVSLERSESLGERDLPSQVGPAKVPVFWNLKLPSGSAGRAVGFIFTPKKDEDEPGEATVSGIVHLVLASDRRELDETLATLALVLGASGFLLLAVTAVVVPRVLSRELSPLHQLADQAARISADSLATRFPTEALPGELTPISSRLNDLLGRLEQYFERERRFSADLAHELRTPIAELRSMAELALKWPEAREAQADREVLAIAMQMEGIVARLLALLRSEQGQLSVVRENVALGPLLERVWQPLAKKAAGKQLDVARDLPDTECIETDPVLLRSILSNIMDNAVEYSPSGGIVRIAAVVVGGTFTLEVTNTVEHLSPDEVPKIFDCFWRKDAARSNNEHSGLGLSLSRAFAQVLGYELTAAMNHESLLTLSLSGPARPAGAEPTPAGR
jgi:two-component system sensor histidine kinase QseC